MQAALSQSQEDYLETILELSAKRGVARVRDIAATMEVSMPSVNGALKRLEKQEFIKHDRYEFVTLTTKGKRRALRVAGKHAILNKFFADFLKVSPENAEADACAIEHHLTEESMAAFQRLFDFVDSGNGGSWLREFHGSIDAKSNDSAAEREEGAVSREI